ncbi:hypothetical protein BVAVS116_C0007 (plasmid) [Borreliella valaisiana VS116]|uniref:Uncharacterized protein n=4 Tax=Borreliella TaxID=64895 RepID=C0R8V0_BORVA|nr:hypothetical protein BVAVS116_C0007 [Borreliella valaisiana VS116]
MFIQNLGVFLMSNINKYNLNSYDKKNLSQINIYNNVENIKKEISNIKENIVKDTSLLDNKILNLEIQMTDLENDIKDIKKEFYKTKALINTIFQEYYTKSILVLITIIPFITTIFSSIVLWIITKFSK